MTPSVIPQSEPERCGLAWAAKVVCSGVYISKRKPIEVLRSSCAWMTAPDEIMRYALATGDPSAIFTLKTEIIEHPKEQAITLRLENGQSATARFFPELGGAMVLPSPTSTPFFGLPQVSPSLETAAFELGELSSQRQATLNAAVDLLFKRQSQFSNAVIVLHRGQVLAERYAGGFDAQAQFESWSMGKSLAATLFGRLEAKGMVSLDERGLFAEWSDGRDQIRARDLLNMASGLQFTGSYSDGEDVATKQQNGLFLDHLFVYAGGVDSYHFCLDKPLEHPPGSFGTYRNCDPLLATALVRQRSDEADFLGFPKRELFAPLGAHGMVLETDPYGHFLISGHDYGRARDWARLGQLYLQRGAWGGQQLLRESFVQFVQTVSPAWAHSPYYGGFFCTNQTGILPLPKDAYWMSGGGGQRVIICPSLDLVLVRLGHMAGEVFGRAATMHESLRQIAEALA